MDGLEADLKGQIEVIRLDILSTFGREIAGRFGVRAVPTTLVVSGEGQITLQQSGIPNRTTLRQAALALLQTP